jgi:hypothetical protein
MATQTVLISGFTDSDITFQPNPPSVKPDDTVVFTLVGLEDYIVTISWDSACPMTDSNNIPINGSNLQPSADRTVSATADGPYPFTVGFQAIVPPGTEEGPEEPGPSHGGLEVSR